ncbi:MAG: PqqD family protein [Lentisphaeria bacterium]|nr:PqqD family protein [Lentisphaeria bacterium]
MKLNPLAMMRTEPDGSGIVFDPENNRALTLNRTGVLIWQLLEKEMPVTAIAAELEKQFTVSLAQAEADVTAFTAGLQEKGLLSES